MGLGYLVRSFYMHSRDKAGFKTTVTVIIKAMLKNYSETVSVKANIEKPDYKPRATRGSRSMSRKRSQ